VPRSPLCAAIACFPRSWWRVDGARAGIASARKRRDTHKFQLANPEVTHSGRSWVSPLSLQKCWVAPVVPLFPNVVAPCLIVEIAAVCARHRARNDPRDVNVGASFLRKGNGSQPCHELGHRVLHRDLLQPMHWNPIEVFLVNAWTRIVTGLEASPGSGSGFGV